LAHYLVIHTPRDPDAERPQPPSRLLDLAKIHGQKGARPRWIRTWSPDLHDDRIFSYWEADTAAEILSTIAAFSFLDEMDATAINVREWGPSDVIDAMDDPS
jgi:hypothetical protein